MNENQRKLLLNVTFLYGNLTKNVLYRKLTLKLGRKTRLPFISCLMPWIFSWPKQTKSSTVRWVLLKNVLKKLKFYLLKQHTSYYAIILQKMLKFACVFIFYTETVQAGKWRGQEEGIRYAKWCHFHYCSEGFQGHCQWCMLLDYTNNKHLP